MNYNKWFYNQHRYLKNSRNGLEGFNDTKWIDINKRYEKLVAMESELLLEQPFLVQGNNVGFDKLIDLMGRSNYTFGDIDDALSETYRVSLQNAMSRNLVNTHAVIFSTNILDSKNVAHDKFTHYKIVEAPFNQLHFGHRDEFIRQKLIDMHTKEGDYYVEISKFNTSSYARILNFSIICSINGFICNDCKIAIDDKGFKFKIGWPYSYDVDFIVYKLDHTQMFSVDIPVDKIMNKNFISYSDLGIDGGNLKGSKAIVNIFDKAYIKTVSTAPNFAMLTENGLKFNSIQPYTFKSLSRQKTATVTIDIYVTKFLHEVPNLYPALNYDDIIDARLVYDDKYEGLRDDTTSKNRIVSTSTNNFNYLEACTPPISLDRDSTYSFTIVIDCLSMYKNMLKYEEDIRALGNGILYGTDIEFGRIWRKKARALHTVLQNFYITYQKGAMLTSLVSSEQIELFQTLVENMDKVAGCANIQQVQSFEFPELYDFNYRTTVTNITKPFHDDKLESFENMGEVSQNFFDKEDSTRFNRPISEECFIALKYNRDQECWIFDYPQIKPFHGIGNTFYIDSKLDGTEMFKFFVLYSDTEDTMEENIEHFDLETVLDFDKFYSEVEKHMGCIRYWDAENRLLKLSKILFSKYDEETAVQVLAKMLKRKIDGKDLINVYPSDMNYEESNKTSDYLELYTENTDRGPFTLNFLFYTLSMLNNNEDRLQAYFYRVLTNTKYNRRYADINISEILDEERYDINYGKYSIAPSRVGTETVNPTGVVYSFYALPLIISTGGSDLYEPYRYVLNVYNTNTKYPFASENGVDHDYYTKYDNLADYSSKVVSYQDNIELGRKISKYLCSLYDVIADLKTNYKKSYGQVGTVMAYVGPGERLRRGFVGLPGSLKVHKQEIYNFLETAHLVNIPGLSNPTDVAHLITQTNVAIDTLEDIRETMLDIDMMILYFNNQIRTYVDKIVLGNLKKVYMLRGFDQHIMKRTRMLYLHLKKINKPMNSYVYRKWLTNIDYDLLNVLDDCLAANTMEPTLGDGIFSQIHDKLIQYRDDTLPRLTQLDNLMTSIDTTVFTTHIAPLALYCKEIINNVIFDMYMLNTPELNMNGQFTTRPVYAVLTLPADHHTTPPIGDTFTGQKNIVFQVITDEVNNRYVMKSLSNICEYVFFDGTTLPGITVKIINELGQILETQTVSLTFTRISSTADKVNNIPQIINSDTTALEFENGHESFEVVDGVIINEKHADMNYELLVGNHFAQLDHDIEYVMEPNTWLQGSIDKIYINNQQINQMINVEFGHKKCSDIYFKPSRVMHITPNLDGSIDSINGKYFDGETIYLKTTDGLTVFPVKITAVDHSINKGFIEAEVDSYNSNWFAINDSQKITEYLTTNVECEVIDDNMRNFLDEFSDETLPAYNNPGYSPANTINDDNVNVYTMPGDPIFVSSNADYVYTRLNWFFNDMVPNRFIDEDHKTHRFIYVDTGFLNANDDRIMINMIDHNFNEMTLPEEYPVLRSEPNDHNIWEEEIATFRRYKNQEFIKYNSLRVKIDRLYAELAEATDPDERDRILLEITTAEGKYKYSLAKYTRLERYIYQLETPTTWFNVISYDASLVYIANGRADKFSPTVIPNIRDLVYTDKMEVFLYDWEHKQWLDPNTYSITTQMVDNLKIGEYDNYTTNRVLTSITITPGTGFNYSKKILVYFAYDKSDVMEDIEMNPTTCHVRFKPLISLDTEKKDYDPYADIRIRKHFDGYEKYAVDAEDLHVKRIKRSGKYTYSPEFRIPDIHIKNGNNEYDYTDIAEFLVPNPMKFSDTQRVFHIPQYATTIVSPVDSFMEDKEIKLICISNNNMSSYDGNISSIMFSGTTSLDNDDQVITITKSTLPNYVEGEFICTVFQNDDYDPSGGVIVVTVTSETEEIYSKEWITVPQSQMRYREIPNEFKIIMNEGITLTDMVEITLRNEYKKSVDDTISLDNVDDNPFEYYYDTKNYLRYPISNTRTNTHDQRLVIDTTVNSDVKIVKSPYIGICRYSRNRIPADGVIDMTGYLPTPLSRDRYEFWVNGRFIDGDSLIILSPTSVQLRNLKSLRNFEVIELVDDINTDNELFKEGNLYVDINGNTYSNFRLAMLSNAKIRHQDIMYGFNANVHNSINDYTKDVISEPNNIDVEDDILSNVQLDDSDAGNYEKMYNLPSINGVTIFHPKLQGLGLSEIPNTKIIEMFDKVWRIEALTNPCFMMTHKQKENIEEETGLKLHIKQLTEPHWEGIQEDTTGMFLLYATGPVDKYFSYYISKTSDGAIDDIENTVKIIPFVMAGVYVLIDKKYQGMWLHSTHGQTKPIRIVNASSEE